MSTGLKANSDGSAAIQVGGTDVITLTSGGAATFVTSPTTVQAGTAAAPSITFSGDTNTGIYSPGADQVAIATGGSQRTVVDASGTLKTNVGGVEGIQLATDLNNSAVSSRLLFTTSTNTVLLVNSSGELFFNTGATKGSASGTTRVIFNANGIGLGANGANSGTGIRFPATQDPSSNAKTLDDYEEGTWDPVVSYSGSTSGVTYNSRTGNYTKVGNTVLVQGEVSVNSKGTGSGTVRISLPFQNIALRGGLAVGNTQQITGTNAARELLIEASTSYFVIRYPSGSGSTSEVDYAAISNGFYIVFAGIYRV